MGSLTVKSPRRRMALTAPPRHGGIDPALGKRWRPSPAPTSCEVGSMRWLLLIAALLLEPDTARASAAFMGIGGVSSALDVSADGSVVVGVSDFGSGPEAFRWTEAGGMVGLGDLPGGDFWSLAWGVS